MTQPDYSNFDVTIVFKNGYKLTRGYVGCEKKDLKRSLVWLIGRMSDKIVRGEHDGT